MVQAWERAFPSFSVLLHYPDRAYRSARDGRHSTHSTTLTSTSHTSQPCLAPPLHSTPLNLLKSHTVLACRYPDPPSSHARHTVPNSLSPRLDSRRETVADLFDLLLVPSLGELPLFRPSSLQAIPSFNRLGLQIFHNIYYSRPDTASNSSRP